MKVLNEFLKELALNHLANFNVVDKTNTDTYIKNSEIEKIINIVNTALIEIYSNYKLLYKSCLILATVPLTTYYLREEYAESNNLPVEDFKYIEDTIETPFYPYVVKIDYILNTNGEKIPQNNFEEQRGWFNVGHDGFQIRNWDYSEYFSIIYQAYHKPILNENYNTQYLEVPPFILKPLKDYITYLFYNSMSGQINIAQATKFYVDYLNQMNKIVADGLIPSINYDTSSKFFRKGFEI